MSLLDGYGLPAGLGRKPEAAFEPPPDPAPMPEPAIAPRLRFAQAPTPPLEFPTPDYFLTRPEERSSGVHKAVAAADEILRRLRSFEVPYPREPAVANTPLPRAAMTPLEGPDTGEGNPNSDATPAGYFRALRGAESTNNPKATNPITKAAGLYQIQPSTFAWLAKVHPDAGLDPAKIYDEDQQDKAVRLYTDRSMRQLVPTLGRMPTAGELYALHFLGHAGGMQFLGGLDRPAKDVIRPADFAANPWMYKYADKPASVLLNKFNSMLGS